MSEAARRHQAEMEAQGYYNDALSVAERRRQAEMRAQYRKLLDEQSQHISDLKDMHHQDQVGKLKEFYKDQVGLPMSRPGLPPPATPPSSRAADFRAKMGEIARRLRRPGKDGRDRKA